MCAIIVHQKAIAIQPVTHGKDIATVEKIYVMKKGVILMQLSMILTYVQLKLCQHTIGFVLSFL